MKNRMKRVLSFLLAAAMLLSNAPLASARVFDDGAQAGIRLEQTNFDPGNGITTKDSLMVQMMVIGIDLE